MVRMIVGIIGLFFILPMVYGGLMGRTSPFRLYACGFMAQFVIFYVLYILMLRLNKGVGALSKSFLLVSAVALVILIVLLSVRKQIGLLLQLIRGIITGVMWYIKKHPLLLVFFVIVIWEIIKMITNTEVAYSDDDTYSPMILDMVSSGGFFGVDPETGYQSSSAYRPELKYMLTAWLPYQAFGSIICDVHPLIFTKTILPVALIVLHYLIVWEFAGTVMDLKKKSEGGGEIKDGRDILMIFYALLMEFGWSSLTTTLSYYFLTWLWYGKAFVQFIGVPLFVMEFINMLNREDRIGVHILRLFVIAVASCAASLMGVFLIGASLPVLIIAAVIYKRINKNGSMMIKGTKGDSICSR